MTDTMIRPPALNIPNLLTIGRVIAVPLLVAALTMLEGATARWIALAIFIFAGVSDFLDGYLARAWQQQSTIGRMLDPIADKLLVGASLLLLVHLGTITGISIWAAVIILCREILVSGLREFLAELKVKLHVSWLSKWKTGLQMLAIGLLIAGPAGDAIYANVSALGISFLWASAILTIWTGYGYFSAAVTHALRT